MFDLPELIRAIGYLGVFAIVFAETGLLLGFFLPGDSLLFTAGILAAEGYMNIWILTIVLLGAAIIGDSTGYAIGKRIGPRIFSKDNSVFFKKSHIAKAQAFFDKHGPKAIIISRFVPIIRTFVPTLAGVGKMHYGKFLSYNIIGAVLWVLVTTWLGYWLGLKIDNIDKYIIPVAGLIILISIAPYLKQYLFNSEVRTKVNSQIRMVLRKVFRRNNI